MGNSCFTPRNNVSSNSDKFFKRRSKKNHSPSDLQPEYVFSLSKYFDEKERLRTWINDENHISYVPSLLFLTSRTISNYVRNLDLLDRLPLLQFLKDCITYHVHPLFDRNFLQENVELLNHGRTLRYRGRGYSTSIVYIPKDRALTQGRHALLYKIEKSRVPGWMQIGVVNKERKQNFLKTIWDGNPHPFRKGEMAQRNNGNYHSGIKPEESCLNSGSIFSGGYTTSDIISVQIDMDNNEIVWCKNGELYGSPKTINGLELFPSISLDSPLEEVSLLAFYSNYNPF